MFLRSLQEKKRRSWQIDFIFLYLRSSKIIWSFPRRKRETLNRKETMQKILVTDIQLHHISAADILPKNPQNISPSRNNKLYCQYIALSYSIAVVAIVAVYEYYTGSARLRAGVCQACSAWLHQYPQVLFHTAALNTFIPQILLTLAISPNP